MDKLADKFFNDPTSFGKAMELLMAYKRETAKNSWESVETFLMGLDEREEHLLQKSLDYSDGKVQQEQSLNEKIQSIRKCIEMMHEGQVYSAIKWKVSSNKEEDNTPLLSELIDRYIDYLSLGWSKGKRHVNEIDIRPRLRLPESVFRQI